MMHTEVFLEPGKACDINFFLFFHFFVFVRNSLPSDKQAFVSSLIAAPEKRDMYHQVGWPVS